MWQKYFEIFLILSTIVIFALTLQSRSILVALDLFNQKFSQWLQNCKKRQYVQSDHNFGTRGHKLDNFLSFDHDYNHNSCILFDIELLNDFFYHIAYIFDLWQGSFCHLVYDQVGHNECIHL